MSAVFEDIGSRLDTPPATNEEPDRPVEAGPRPFWQAAESALLRQLWRTAPLTLVITSPGRRLKDALAEQPADEPAIKGYVFGAWEAADPLALLHGALSEADTGLSPLLGDSPSLLERARLRSSGGAPPLHLALDRFDVFLRRLKRGQLQDVEAELQALIRGNSGHVRLLIGVDQRSHQDALAWGEGLPRFADETLNVADPRLAAWREEPSATEVPSTPKRSTSSNLSQTTPDLSGRPSISLFYGTATTETALCTPTSPLSRRPRARRCSGPSHQ
mgnify:CR=1 FL=1